MAWAVKGALSPGSRYEQIALLDEGPAELHMRGVIFTYARGARGVHWLAAVVGTVR